MVLHRRVLIVETKASSNPNIILQLNSNTLHLEVKALTWLETEVLNILLSKKTLRVTFKIWRKQLLETKKGEVMLRNREEVQMVDLVSYLHQVSYSIIIKFSFTFLVNQANNFLKFVVFWILLTLNILQAKILLSSIILRQQRTCLTRALAWSIIV